MVYLEVGKEFKSKNGMQIKIVYKNNSIEFPFLAVWGKNDDGSEATGWYSANGEYFNYVSGLDIISEWPETKVFERWILINEEGKILNVYINNISSSNYPDDWSIIHVKQEYEVGQDG